MAVALSGAGLAVALDTSWQLTIALNTTGLAVALDTSWLTVALTACCRACVGIGSPESFLGTYTHAKRFPILYFLYCIQAASDPFVAVTDRKSVV